MQNLFDHRFWCEKWNLGYVIFPVWSLIMAKLCAVQSSEGSEKEKIEVTCKTAWIKQRSHSNYRALKVPNVVIVHRLFFRPFFFVFSSTVPFQSNHFSLTARSIFFSVLRNVKMRWLEKTTYIQFWILN